MGRQGKAARGLESGWGRARVTFSKRPPRPCPFCGAGAGGAKPPRPLRG